MNEQPLVTEDGTQLDPKVVKVVRTIRQLESGGHADPYNAVGDNGAAKGAYQFNEKTGKGWKNFAKEFLGDENAQMTPANQNKVAYSQVKKWKDQGLQPDEIDALWNGAKKDPATNKYVHNDQDRANKFRQALGTVAAPATTAQQPQQPQNSLIPTANAQTQTPQAPQSEQHASTEPKKDWLDSLSGTLSSIFGGDKIGDLIGTQIAKWQNPEQAKYLNGPTAGEVLGDAAQIALTLVPLGRAAGAVGKGAGLVSKLAKGAVGAEKVLAPAAGFVGKAGRVASTLAKGTALGAGFGATQAMKDQKDIGQGALTGGALGFGVGGVGMAASKLLNVLPRWFVGAGLKGAEKETVQTALGKKFMTIQGGLKEVDRDIDKIDSSIEKILTKPKYPLTTAARVASENRSVIDRVVNGYTDRTGKAIQGFPHSGYTADSIIANARKLVPEHSKLIDKLATNKANLSEINTLRSAIDKRVKSVYVSMATPPETKELGAALAGSLRDYVQTKAPKTQALFQEYSKNVELSKLLDKIATRGDKSHGLGFMDLMSIIMGGAGAGPMGSAGAFALSKAAQSPTTNIVAGRALQKATPALQTGGLMAKLAALKGGSAITQ